MVMHRADGAGGKIHLYGHHFAVVRQNAAGYAIAEVNRIARCLFSIKTPPLKTSAMA
jgi:hypothetical protein